MGQAYVREGDRPVGENTPLGLGIIRQEFIFGTKN